jgi:hypothetical protein
MAAYEIRELQHQLKVYKHGRYIAALQQGAFRPYIHPVITPGGHAVTQISPVDHLHHQGIWFGHQDVDGVNFWNPESEFPAPLMVATSTKTDVHPDSVTFHQEVQWRDGEDDIRLTDVRVITVCEELDHTAIDVTVTLRAGNSDIAMGQTKEAGLAVRVADQIDVIDGGRIENADGCVNEAGTFDQISDWVDYAGPISRTETAGIAIFPHPGSVGIPWFTRDYGPIYVSPWRHAPLQLAAGTSRTIGARFVAHDGKCEEANIADIYARFRAEVDG